MATVKPLVLENGAKREMTSLDTLPVANIPAMVGATAGVAGTAGVVPAPAAGDENRVLTGGGAYRTIAAAPGGYFGLLDGLGVFAGPINTITVGTGPFYMAYSPLGYMYVTNNASNSVKVIRCSDNVVVATITVGTGPYGVAYSPLGYMYVANNASNSVSVIRCSDNVVVATITVGTGPYGVAYSPLGYMYVANNASNSVSVLVRG